MILFEVNSPAHGVVGSEKGPQAQKSKSKLLLFVMRIVNVPATPIFMWNQKGGLFVYGVMHP